MLKLLTILYLTPLTILSRSALILSWQRDLMTSRSGDLTGDFLYIACLVLVTRVFILTVLAAILRLSDPAKVSPSEVYQGFPQLHLVDLGAELGWVRDPGVVGLLLVAEAGVHRLYTRGVRPPQASPSPLEILLQM